MDDLRKAGYAVQVSYDERGNQVLGVSGLGVQMTFKNTDAAHVASLTGAARISSASAQLPGT